MAVPNSSRQRRDNPGAGCRGIHRTSASGCSPGAECASPSAGRTPCPGVRRARRIARGLVLAPGPEGDAAVLVTDDAAVGDRSARQVARQILQHLDRIALAMGRSLDEHIPVRLSELGQPGLELLWLAAARPTLLPVATSRPAPADENRRRTSRGTFAPAARCPPGTASGGCVGRMTARDPTSAVERRPASWDQHMKVWMMVELLVSRVQHHQGRRLELARLRSTSSSDCQALRNSKSYSSRRLPRISGENRSGSVNTTWK